jgi:hypothetical protein
LVFSLGLGEIVLRSFFPMEYPWVPAFMQLYKYHPSFGWTMQPSINMDDHLVTNAGGWRGKTVPYPRGSKRRILVLGDSFAFGFGVADTESLFSRKLEESLCDTEVVNLGVSGYSTLQELLLYKSEGVKYKPDIVVLVFHENDFHENTMAYSFGILRPIATVDESGRLELPKHRLPIVPGWGGKWVDGDSLRERLYRRLHLYRRWNSFLVELVKADTEIDAGNLELPVFPSRDSREGRVTLALLRALHEEVLWSGARLLIVTTPSATRVWTETWEEKKHKYSLQEDQRYEAYENFFVPLEDDAIIVEHSSREFIEKEAGGGRNYSKIHWHWNEDGHRVFSGILVSMLNKHFPGCPKP